jgi:hypothetical protein
VHAIGRKRAASISLLVLTEFAANNCAEHDAAAQLGSACQHREHMQMVLAVDGSKQAPLRFQIMRRMLLLIGLFALSPLAFAQDQKRPSLIPPGWSLMSGEDERGRRFVSRDGQSWMTATSSPADRHALDVDMDEIARRPGEKITYLSRGRTWIAVSGYRSGNIFYRKSNLACGGRRWHHIEFQYPISEKRRMDATVTRIAREMTRYGDDCLG